MFQRCLEMFRHAPGIDSQVQEIYLQARKIDSRVLGIYLERRKIYLRPLEIHLPRLGMYLLVQKIDLLVHGEHLRAPPGHLRLLPERPEGSGRHLPVPGGCLPPAGTFPAVPATSPAAAG